MKTRFGDIQIANSERFSCHPNGFGISPYLQEKLVFLGQFEGYQQASEMAQTRLGILIGPSQIDRLTRYYRAAIADPLEQPVTTNEPASEVVYAQVDGAMLLTEEGYKEAKLGRIFTASSLKESPVDERGGYITSSLFVAHIGTVAQFSPKFDAQLESHTSRGPTWFSLVTGRFGFVR